MSDPIDIWLYGAIGDEIEAEPIVRALAAGDAAAGVVVRINSPGGAVSEGQAIYNALLRYPGHVRVEIDGLAASIASLIAMAGDNVVMAENALLMVHAPWAATQGNADNLRKNAAALDKVADTMVGAYIRKSRLPENHIREIMESETWFTPAEALEAGFIDEITQPLAIAASIDLDQFNSVPTHILEKYEMAKQADQTARAANTATTDQTAQAAVLAFQARESARREEIKAAFRTVKSGQSEDSLPRFQALEERCLADFSCDTGIARERLLTEMGRGCEPLAGGAIRADGTVPGQYGAGSHVSISGDGGAFMAAATDGLLQRCGIGVKEPHPAARDFANVSIGELATICTSRAGMRFDFGASRGDHIKAAQTTSDFPSILENIQEKAIIAGLEGEGIATHRIWTKPGDLADFKRASRVAMSEAPDLREVGEAGEITYGAVLDAGAEQIFLKTYAKGLSLTRQALVDDDLGAFARIPVMLGQSAARTEADLVYNILDSNPTMRDGKALFHADHGNLAATGSAITVDTLSTARAAMRRQRGPAGLAYLNIVPRFLICGANREGEALKVLSQLTPAKADDVTPQWIQQLTLVVDPRLDDQANSAWYLAANPTTHDTIEVAFLDGRRAPSIERAEDFDNLNMRWRCVFDFGCAAIDWRGLHKNPGTA